MSKKSKIVILSTKKIIILLQRKVYMSQETNDTLFLFSSNAQELYKTDILNTISAPLGWVQHFRYQKKYVDDRLWNKNGQRRTQQELNRYLGNKVLVTFVDQRKDGEEKWQIFGIYPVRYGEITELRIIDNVLHVWFKLQEYFEYFHGSLTRSVENLNEFLLNLLRKSEPNNQKYAIFFSVPSLGTTQQLVNEEAFGTVVEALSDRGLPKVTTLFTRVSDFTETQRESEMDGVLKHRTRSLPLLAGPAAGMMGYELMDSATYSLFLTSFNTELPGTKSIRAKLSLSFNKDYLEVIGPNEYPIIGRYDQYQFVIKPKRQARDQWTTMRVYCTQESIPGNGEGKEKENPVAISGLSWEVPVLVKADRNREAVQFASDLAVSVGVALTALNQLQLFKDPDSANRIKIASLILLPFSIVLVAIRFFVNRR